MSNPALAMRDDELQSGGEPEVPVEAEVEKPAVVEAVIDRSGVDESFRERLEAKGSFDWSRLDKDMGYLWRFGQTPEGQAIIGAVQKVKSFVGELIGVGQRAIKPVFDIRNEMREIAEVRRFIREDGAVQKADASSPSQITIHDFRYELYDRFSQFIRDLGVSGRLHVPHLEEERIELVNHLLDLAEEQLRTKLQEEGDIQRIMAALHKLAGKIREFSPEQRQIFMATRFDRMRDIGKIPDLRAINQNLYERVCEKYAERYCFAFYLNRVMTAWVDIFDEKLAVNPNFFKGCSNNPDYFIAANFRSVLFHLEKCDITADDILIKLRELADRFKEAENYIQVARAIDIFIASYSNPVPLLQPKKKEEPGPEGKPKSPDVSPPVLSVVSRDDFEDAILSRRYGLVEGLRLVCRVVEIDPLTTKEELIKEIERLGRDLKPIARRKMPLMSGVVQKEKVSPETPSAPRPMQYYVVIPAAPKATPSSIDDGGNLPDLPMRRRVSTPKIDYIHEAPELLVGGSSRITFIDLSGSTSVAGDDEMAAALEETAAALIATKAKKE